MLSKIYNRKNRHPSPISRKHSSAGFLLGLLTLFLLLCNVSAQHVQYQFVNGTRPWEAWGGEISFDDLDLKPLQDETRKRNEKLSDEELAYVVQRNFHFVFFNKVARQNFLSTPPPEHVMEKILDILQLNDRMAAEIREGKRKVLAGNLTQLRQNIHEIERYAEGISKIFNQYFLEAEETTYTVRIPNVKTDNYQFLHYLIQADRINRLISQKVDEYFFDPEPGVVNASDYQRGASVPVLAKSLIKLSSVTVHKLLGR